MVTLTGKVERHCAISGVGTGMRARQIIKHLLPLVCTNLACIYKQTLQYVVFS